MSKLPLLLVLSVVSSGPFSISSDAHAVSPKVVYGIDNRVDVDAHPSYQYKFLAKSTAAMISNQLIDSSLNLGTTITLKGRKLGERMPLCPGEKFANQQTAANCSGFLISPTLLVTAGHCIQSEADCAGSKWVFDFKQNLSSTSSDITVKKSSVYSCKRVVKNRLDNQTMSDFAVIELDRKVTDRAPVVIRRSGSIAAGEGLVIIGHPSGLPGKIADGAKVRSTANPVFFTANLDSFGGNSGSAVFNARTGVVEGILVRGEQDYERDLNRGCIKVKQCSDFGCRGEDVTRITEIFK